MPANAALHAEDLAHLIHAKAVNEHQDDARQDAGADSEYALTSLRTSSYCLRIV
jgi:hypothetical protein